MSKKLAPNKAAIIEHLNFLFAGQTSGLIEIAYTPTATSSVNSALFFSVLELEQAAQFAAEKNATEGINVYVGASLRSDNTAPFGRSNNNDYYKATAIWCDLDDVQAARHAKDKYKDMPPSFVVVTGRHPDLRAQVWWKLETPIEAPMTLKQALSNVCSALNGDKAVVDPIRVMRLGGTIAWPKKEGRIPEMTETTTPKNATTSVTIEAFTSYFPTVAPVDTRAAVGGVDLNSQPKSSLKLTGWSIDDVREHLSYINPDCGYDEWIAVGMALHAEGHGFNLWDEWSQRGSKYDAAVMRPHWKSFKGTGVSYGTIVHMAKAGGWKPKNGIQTSVSNFARIPAQIDNSETFDPETGEIIEVQKTSGLYYIKAKDIKPTIDVSDFVQDTLENGALSVVYGESNCGKTFFATDLCLHVAQGERWREKRVEQGGVIYAALEGKAGIGNRIAAYNREKMLLGSDIPFGVMPCQLDFFSPENNIPEFIELLKRASDDFNSVKIVVIDTLARALMGGDENSGQDMGLLVSYADKIRNATGAHVMFIHHSGKDKARGARGHSCLRAAVDTEIEISRDEGADYSTIRIAKQKEMEAYDPMAFGLKVVNLGENKYGEMKTSCVVIPKEAQEKQRRVVCLTPLQQFIYDAVIEGVSKCGERKTVYAGTAPVVCVSYENVRLILEDRGFKDILVSENKTTSAQVKSATQTARLALKKHGKINFNGNYIWLASDADLGGQYGEV